MMGREWVSPSLSPVAMPVSGHRPTPRINHNILTAPIEPPDPASPLQRLFSGTVRGMLTEASEPSASAPWRGGCPLPFHLPSFLFLAVFLCASHPLWSTVELRPLSRSVVANAAEIHS